MITPLQQHYERFDSESPIPKSATLDPDTTPPPSYEESSAHAQYYPVMADPQQTGHYQQDNSLQQYQHNQPMTWPPIQPCPGYSNVVDQPHQCEKRPLTVSCPQTPEVTSQSGVVRQYPTAPAYGEVHHRAVTAAPSAPTLPGYPGPPPKC